MEMAQEPAGRAPLQDGLLDHDLEIGGEIPIVCPAGERHRGPDK
jgi:hypothetical protein